MVLRRRKFLTQLAAISGMGAAFLSMQALGLSSTVFAEPAPMLPAKIGYGTHVVISVSYTHLTLPTICSV